MSKQRVPRVALSAVAAAAVLGSGHVSAQQGTCGPCPHPGFCPPTFPLGFFCSEDHRCEDLTQYDFTLTFKALCDADLSYADLSGADLFDAELARANLTAALLIETNLHGAILCDADFSGANLTGADLTATLPSSVCETFFQPDPPPRYDCDTIWDGTVYDVATGGLDPELAGWILTNPPCAAATSYGSLAATGSLVPLSDRPSLGSVFTVGVDDPFGASASGSLVALVVSSEPDANSFDRTTPAGTLLPGLGMTGDSGELLVSLRPPDPLATFVGDSPWLQPGSPVPVDVPIPDAPFLLGATVYTQGVLVAPGNVKLTEGWILSLGN